TATANTPQRSIQGGGRQRTFTCCQRTLVWGPNLNPRPSLNPGVGSRNDLQYESPNKPEPYNPRSSPPEIKNGDLSSDYERFDHVQEVSLLNAPTDFFGYEQPPF